MDFFAASNSYDFFNQYCSNLLKNPTVRGLTSLISDVKHLRAFGCVNYAHIAKDERRKLDPVAKHCILVGYSSEIDFMILVVEKYSSAEV